MPKRKREIKEVINTTQIKENIVNSFSNSFSNITFKFSNGKYIKYHKILLHKDSQYFRDLFDINKDIKEIDTTGIKYLSDYELMLDYIIIVENIDISDDIIIDYVKLIDLHEYINSEYIDYIINNICKIKLNNKFDVYISILNNYCIKDKYINKITIINKIIKKNIIQNTHKTIIECIRKLNEIALYLLFSELSRNYLNNRNIICEIFNTTNKININDIKKIIKLIGDDKLNILLYHYIFDNFDFNKIKQYYLYFKFLEKINNFISGNKSKNTDNIEKNMEEESEEESEED